MIDLALLRQEPEKIKKLILKKEPSFPVDTLIELDHDVRATMVSAEELRKQRNELSKKGAQAVTPELRQLSISLGEQIKSYETKLEELSQQFNQLALSCPNIPQEDLPEGGKEQNKPVKVIGEKPNFTFTPKNHLELNTTNSWFDLPTATNISGSNFVIYKHEGLKVLYALTQIMIKNNVKYGFEPILTPYLVQEQALVNSGNLPKFQGDFYTIQDENLCLIPTSEVALTNLHANQILAAEELPKRYTSWTSCFRREAGGYGTDERGLIRIHQFEKVELYSLCTPESSNDELERMLTCAQDILQQLGLHYRVSLLAMQDCSFCSSKTYDIEVWLPGQQRYYEVSSCSNCTDFQARRSKIRFRSNPDAKPQLVHTLNGSSLALPRLMVALMEQFQQKDGSIKLPLVLTETMKNLW